jgi:glutamate synthase (ferredoxin)
MQFDLKGVAGQSSEPFCRPGHDAEAGWPGQRLRRQGLCGGELILRGEGRAARESGKHVILGNVALYGATSGALYAAGRAGERFAVRNSGAWPLSRAWATTAANT